MSEFFRVEYPTCPACGVLINDMKIFTLQDIQCQRFFHQKECPKCSKPFLMKVRVELFTETVAAEEVG